MFAIFKKLFSKTPKKAVIIEYLKSNNHSDIAVHAANFTGMLEIFDGENAEQKMRNWVKKNNCRIVHEYVFAV
jgi:hypothetical protein